MGLICIIGKRGSQREVMPSSWDMMHYSTLQAPHAMLICAIFID